MNDGFTLGELGNFLDRRNAPEKAREGILKNAKGVAVKDRFHAEDLPHIFGRSGKIIHDFMCNVHMDPPKVANPPPAKIPRWDRGKPGSRR